MKMIEAPKITSADSPRTVIDAMNATRRADAMKTGRLDLSHTAVISKARTIADCRPQRILSELKQLFKPPCGVAAERSECRVTTIGI